MKFHHHWAATALFVVVLGVSSVSNAALVSRLGGLAVYDTDINITWLADANLAATNTFSVSGITSGYMTWGTAQSWIGAMNANNYLGYHDWRLPTTLQPDATCGFQIGGDSFGANCTGSEMGHLFYNELGGGAGQPINTTHNANFSLFQNIQLFPYWSGTEYASNTLNAWYFIMNNGNQTADSKLNNSYAWAVRTGDVAAVPVPAAAWLFGSGLLGLIGVARRKAA